MDDFSAETHPQVFDTITQVVELVADDKIALATERLTALVAQFPQEGFAHAYLAWVSRARDGTGTRWSMGGRPCSLRRGQSGFRCFSFGCCGVRTSGSRH